MISPLMAWKIRAASIDEDEDKERAEWEWLKK